MCDVVTRLRERRVKIEIIADDDADDADDVDQTISK